jgi:hypothetical protein
LVKFFLLFTQQAWKKHTLSSITKLRLSCSKNKGQTLLSPRSEIKT